MAKTVEKSEKGRSVGAAVIRDLRGPLPEDDPDMIWVDGVYRPRPRPERSATDQEAVRAVLHDLSAIPDDVQLSNAEILGFIRRMPPVSEQFTSAHVIRQMRGPLPDDDPDVALYGRR